MDHQLRKKISKKTYLVQAKDIIKDLLPPILIRMPKVFRRGVCYSGNYRSWEEASHHSTGYDSGIILDKVKTSLLKVKEGQAAFERDSVLFDEISYSWPILAGLLRAASSHDNTLRVLDFGGSLGSHYYQYKSFLSDLNYLRWSIVEQKRMVECGKKLFENGHLVFHHEIEECLQHEIPNVILLSGVIQYLPMPYSFLKRIIQYNFEYILIDRTPFIEIGSDRLTIQKVPPWIYDATYPAWFFDLDKFLNVFQDKYDILVEFSALAGDIHIKKPRGIARDMGFILKLKNEHLVTVYHENDYNRIK